VNRHWCVACLELTPCIAAGALVLYATQTETFGGAGSFSSGGNFVRIELPRVQLADQEHLTDLDTAVMLREPLDAAEARVTPQTPVPLASAAIPADRTQGSEQSLKKPTQQVRTSNGLMDVSFDLSQSAGSDRSAIELRKGVRFNGTDAGQVTIRVGAGSSLFIASDDLRTLLSAAQRADLVDSLSSGGEQPFVGFDEVRRKGLNLRYDAASDQIVISG
jgi:hypothetical protein